MSYESDLKEHYRQVRRRMNMGVKTPIVPRLLISHFTPPGGVAGGTGLVIPQPPEVPVEVKPLISVHAEERAEESERRRQGQLNSEYPKNRIELEAAAAPMLPPLPDTGKQIVFSRWRKLVEAVCEQHDVPVKEVLGLARRRPVINARFECMYRMRYELLMSYPQIAEKLGRDHSTTLHGVKVVRERLLDAASKQVQAHGALAHGMSPSRDATPHQLVAA